MAAGTDWALAAVSHGTGRLFNRCGHGGY